MHDIKHLRDNPAAFDKGLARRGLPPMAEKILAIDENWRKLQRELEESLAARNAGSAKIAELKKITTTRRGRNEAIARIKN